MKPKTKKPKMKKPKTKKQGKQMKDKSVKQEVRVNVQSSGGGASGGASIPTPQPILSAFKQAEKTGENVDIKNLTDIINKMGVGLSEKTAQTSNDAFKNILSKVNELSDFQKDYLENLHRQNTLNMDKEQERMINKEQKRLKKIENLMRQEEQEAMKMQDLDIQRLEDERIWNEYKKNEEEEANRRKQRESKYFSFEE